MLIPLFFAGIYLLMTLPVVVHVTAGFGGGYANASAEVGMLDIVSWRIDLRPVRSRRKVLPELRSRYAAKQYRRNADKDRQNRALIVRLALRARFDSVRAAAIVGCAGDAAAAALSAGALSAFLRGACARYGIPCENIRIYPCEYQSVFALEGECIASLCLGDIILAAFSHAAKQKKK